MKLVLTVLSIILSFGFANAHMRTHNNVGNQDIITALQQIDSELVDYNHNSRAIKMAYSEIREMLKELTRTQAPKAINPTDADIINLMEQIDTALARNTRRGDLREMQRELKYVLMNLINNRTGSAGIAVLSFDDVTDPFSFPIAIVGGTARTNLFSITNTGSAQATGISSAGSTNFNVISGGTCGTSLAAGASCTVNVEFRPLSFGAIMGTLTINSNAGSIVKNLFGSGSN